MSRILIREKLVELAASFIILLPSILLYAWQAALPNPGVYWLILTGGCGMLVGALVLRERRRGTWRLKRFLSSCGGFVCMLLFLLYQCVQAL